MFFGRANSTTYIGSGVSWSGFASPINRDDTTAHFSRGIVTLNGATPVAVPFRAIVAEDGSRHLGGNKVILTLRTAAGTPGLPPLATVTGGTGFSVTGIALDTSTYDYAVI